MELVMNSMSEEVASPAEGLTCYVCDGNVIGRYYTLASCKAQVSKQSIVEKLGQLVGEQYVVVISEDDIICRSCTTMMNTLDRLEKEMSSVRSVILRFLEKKYKLDDGELASSKVVLPPAPSQPEAINTLKKISNPVQSFYDRKKQSLKQSINHETDKKSSVWMQCDRCQYTTPYSSFMINHIHKHSEPLKAIPTEQTVVQQESPQPEVSDERHEVEVDELAPSHNDDDGVPELLTNGNDCGEDNVEEVQLEDQEQEDQDLDKVLDINAENLCIVDENGLVIQEVHQSDEGEFYIMEDDEDGTKQMLSLPEDGSIMWNDDNMQF